MMSTGFSTPVAPAGFDVPPLSVRRFTVAEYERLGETGVLTEDDSVELLEGLIVKKMTKNPLHDATIDLLTRVFSRQLPPGWFLRVQNVLRTDDSEPEPDVVIAIGDPVDFCRTHPAARDVVLVIEVAESSLEQDWRKCRIYARAGVNQYWIVDLNAFCVEVFTQPNRTTGEYASHIRLTSHETLALSLSAEKVIKVALSEFLPASGA
jgi:Uma2 family endonuclease